MTFRTEPVGDMADCRKTCPRVIVAEGVIADSTPDAFRAFLREQRGAGRLSNKLFIHSRGGNLIAAMELGILLRRQHMVVIVGKVDRASDYGDSLKSGVPVNFGECISACVFALMGGQGRYVMDYSVVGVHRIYTQGSVDVAAQDKPQMKEYASGDMVQGMRRYARQMGVRPELIDLAESVDPSDVRRLSEAELHRFRLARRAF